MKVVFFDIDGVLNHYGGDYLESSHINLFNELWVKTNALFVMTSNWRIDFHGSCSLIEKYGGIFPIIGCTPNHLYDESELEKTRGAEIKHWIKDNIQNKTDFQYIIIDDVECAISDEQIERFVLTDYKVGFTEKDLEKSVNMFY